MILPSYH